MVTIGETVEKLPLVCSGIGPTLKEVPALAASGEKNKQLSCGVGHRSLTSDATGSGWLIELSACEQPGRPSVAALLGSFKQPAFALRPHDEQWTGHEDRRIGPYDDTP